MYFNSAIFILIDSIEILNIWGAAKIKANGSSSKSSVVPPPIFVRTYEVKID